MKTPNSDNLYDNVFDLGFLKRKSLNKNHKKKNIELWVDAQD
ncbi:hypothetical protein [Candidatus Venteria ishoeyi]|uniref:Uncharacterized protein n=1 Tax=Candidatus Venteria ishoeyi TaxID=1899563 RepID=A0A1H6F7W6_9GAMM|nr:hypothetical protein [Candidatus Venteria ishoeyi]SEH05146.1 Uncharacterised protein [Candidatus Venteria ishoeyi]